jgi:hypothetical protein
MQEIAASLHGSSVEQVAPELQATQLPALHTLFVPQVVPSGAVPIARQVAVPVWQVMAPTWQGSLGMQLPPAVQLLHIPPLHTLLFPQEFPSATLPVSAQTEVPVAHDVAPVRHTAPGVQVIPAVQLLHIPPLHTLLFPQESPSATLPVSAQTEVPVAHDVAPVRQAFAGVQAVPAVQTPQIPPPHTMVVPQEVPLETFPDSVQTGAPVSQVVVPVRHGLPLTLQVAPAVQLPQLPVAPQTLFVPQLVPATRSVPLSLQTGVPVAHDSAPRWQGFVGTQLAPSAQVLHRPARQTIPVPHEVPFGWSPESAQTETPVKHESVPVRQAFPAGEQVPPAAQVTQAPLLQTLSAPQTVPFAWGCCVSVQDAIPCEQAVCPT